MKKNTENCERILKECNSKNSFFLCKYSVLMIVFSIRFVIFSFSMDRITVKSKLVQPYVDGEFTYQVGDLVVMGHFFEKVKRQGDYIIYRYFMQIEKADNIIIHPP